jgi:hypothetical protein
VPLNLGETAASALEDTPTCPCEDPTQGTGTAVGATYMALAPLEGIEDRTSGLAPWDNSPLVRSLGLLGDAHVASFLSVE